MDTEFLAGMWKVEFNADATSSFGSVKKIDLYESPTGLHYFHPPLEGDAAFYTGVYKALHPRSFARENHPREEFLMAARRVSANDRVLDVGCGFGGFRSVVPQARYFGLDPHFAEKNVEWASSQTLAEHLVTHAGQYDVVCAFQVIEHVKDPLAYVHEMALAARSGGRLAIGVPHVPSAMTRIPNWMFNAPPHHLTWWTRDALARLSERVGLEVESIEQVPWGELDSEIYWIERSLSVRTKGGVYYEHNWSAHAAIVAAFTIGKLKNRLKGVPRDPRDEGAALLLIARKP